MPLLACFQSRNCFQQQLFGNCGNLAVINNLISVAIWVNASWAHDLLSFFPAWMSAPRRVGAIAPSSAALGELSTREISPESAPVLELGPGTGVFTYELLKRGLRQQDLTLVESGADFIGLLQMRFPGARVLWMQLGVANPQARRRAGAAGLEVVEDRGVKIEHGRLFGGLGWAGRITRGGWDGVGGSLSGAGARRAEGQGSWRSRDGQVAAWRASRTPPGVAPTAGTEVRWGVRQMDYPLGTPDFTPVVRAGGGDRCGRAARAVTAPAPRHP